MLFDAIVFHKMMMIIMNELFVAFWLLWAHKLRNDAKK